MILQYLILFLIALVLAWVLNKMYFNEKPLSDNKALLFSILFFVVITLVLFVLNILNISAENPSKKIVDFSGLLFSVLFFFRLNKIKIEVYQVVDEKGKIIASYKDLAKAESFLIHNTNKNYSIKLKP
jgi:hypothetical protein